jgi:hypothetical protein
MELVSVVEVSEPWGTEPTSSVVVVTIVGVAGFPSAMVEDGGSRTVLVLVGAEGDGATPISVCKNQWDNTSLEY